MGGKKFYLEDTDNKQHYLKTHKRTHSREGGFQIIEVEKEKKKKKLMSRAPQKFYKKETKPKVQLKTSRKPREVSHDDEYEAVRTIHHAYDEDCNLRHYGIKKIKVGGHVVNLEEVDLELEPSEYPEKRTRRIT